MSADHNSIQIDLPRHHGRMDSVDIELKQDPSVFEPATDKKMMPGEEFP